MDSSLTVAGPTQPLRPAPKPTATSRTTGSSEAKTGESKPASIAAPARPARGRMACRHNQDIRMKAVSVHVVDIANGRVARGMRIQIVRLDGPAGEPVLEGTVGNNGLVEDLRPEDLFEVGSYELRLHVAEYYRKLGTALPEPAFMDVQVFRFGLSDLSQHYHLPVKLTPWGLSLFRGA